MFSVVGFFGMPGPLELLIILAILGIPLAAVIVVLVIVQQQSRERMGGRGSLPAPDAARADKPPMAPTDDRPDAADQPLDAQVLEEQGGKR